jgi:hypothetical protein
MMGFETPESIAEELVLTTDNNGDIYRQQTLSILTNLATKKARGDYNHDKAVQAFMYLAETGARAYVRDFGGGAWHEVFPIEVRRLAATHWRNEFEQNYANGEYERLLPMKYRQPTPQQARALVIFIKKHGEAKWKLILRNCWLASSYPGMTETEAAHLQIVRNNLGPGWLAKASAAKLKQITRSE